MIIFLHFMLNQLKNTQKTKRLVVNASGCSRNFFELATLGHIQISLKGGKGAKHIKGQKSTSKFNSYRSLPIIIYNFIIISFKIWRCRKNK